MSTNTSSIAETKGTPVQNPGILVSRELLDKAKSAIASNREYAFDRLPSDNELLGLIVAQTFPGLSGNPLYFMCVPERDQTHAWFGNEWCEKVKSLRAPAGPILDLGRFVDACVVAYLYGEGGLRCLCTASRLIYPQRLGPEKLAKIQNTVAEIANVKSVESKFIPTSLPQEK